MPVAPTTSARPSAHHGYRPLSSTHAAGAISAKPIAIARRRRRTSRSMNPRARARDIGGSVCELRIADCGLLAAKWWRVRRPDCDVHSRNPQSAVRNPQSAVRSNDQQVGAREIAYLDVLTLPIREVLPATPRARLARLDLDGHAFDYLPGQAVSIAVHGHEKRRPYSIAGAPADARRDGALELLIGVDQEGKPGPHLELEIGTLIDVDGPLGTFTFPAAPEERRFIFIAGGTGIAPLRAMLRHALMLPHRNIGLFYSARTPDEFAFEDELRRLAASGEIELRQTVTRAQDSDWTGARGRLKRDALEELVHDPATLCFVCGPPSLVDEMPKVLAELGIPPERIRIEEWG